MQRVAIIVPPEGFQMLDGPAVQCLSLPTECGKRVYDVEGSNAFQRPVSFGTPDPVR